MTINTTFTLNITIFISQFHQINFINYNNNILTASYSIWTCGEYTTDWEWTSSGQLFVDSYERWAPGQPVTTTGAVVMTQSEDWALTVQDMSTKYLTNICETGMLSNKSCSLTNYVSIKC